MHVADMLPRTYRSTVWQAAQPERITVRRTWIGETHRTPLTTASTAAVLAALVFAASHAALIDDSYITLGFVRDVALHGHWGLISSRVSNTATSPLNILVLAGVTLLVRDPVLAAGVVQIGSAAGTAVLLDRALAARGLPRWPAFAAVVLTLLNPFVVSSTGLESAVAVAGIAALLATAVTARAAAFGAVAALLTLTRGDLVVVPVVMALGTRALWPGWRRMLATAVAVLLPWLAWSWWFLGSALPDTLLIKVDFGGWPKLGRDWFFSDGLLLYLRVYPVATAISLLGVGVGLLALAAFAVQRVRHHFGHWFSAGFRDGFSHGFNPGSSHGSSRQFSRRFGHVHRIALPLQRDLPPEQLLQPHPNAGSALTPFALLAMAGVVHWGVYSLLDIAPYHWYYAPLIATLGLWSAACIAYLWDRKPLTSVALATFLATPTLVFLAGLGTAWQVMPITTNWGLPGQYRAIGEQVGRTVGRTAVTTPGEVGTIAYYCGCQISDKFSDRALIMPMIAKARATSGMAGWLWRLNYARAPHHLAPMRTKYQMSTDPSGAGHKKAWLVFSPWNPGLRSYVTMDGPNG